MINIGTANFLTSEELYGAPSHSIKTIGTTECLLESAIFLVLLI